MENDEILGAIVAILCRDSIENQQDDYKDTDLITSNDTYLGPTPPTPQMMNLTQHLKRHTPL
jgi:hypothetical protein